MTAEQVARVAGLMASDARKKMLPIVKQTIANYAALGPAAARGDTDIVRQHLRVLKKIPEARAVYMALGHAALAHLPMRERKQLTEILSAKSH